MARLVRGGMLNGYSTDAGARVRKVGLVRPAGARQKHPMRLRAAGSGLVLATLMLGAVPAAQGQAQDDCVPIADLAKDPVGTFPADWKVRKDEGKSVYSIRDENGKHVLHADSKGLGIQAAFEHEWDLDTYPILAWSWRPLVFPTGADERKSSTNDSVLAVFQLGAQSLVRGTNGVKCLWIEQVRLVAPESSNGRLAQLVVLRTGTDNQGQ